jgi:hypothetical protein
MVERFRHPVLNQRMTVRDGAARVPPAGAKLARKRVISRSKPLSLAPRSDE